MQKFEPDQLVLVKDLEVRLWGLRRYSMPVFGVLHGTQDGKLWGDTAVIPYQGNENLQRHSETLQVFLDSLHGKKNENDSRGVWDFIAPLLCSFRR